jgi:hypothetical protein
MNTEEPLAFAAHGRTGLRDRSLGLSRRGFPWGRLALAAIACLLTLSGCRGDHSSGVDGDQHAEHAGHIVPAHKPKTFGDAVRRLRALNETISLGVGRGEAEALVADKTLSMALDIAAWLPEIAADSDMPEAPWDEVNSRSVMLVADYQTVLAVAGSPDHAADALAAVRDADQRISDLEKLLASADPRWFDQIDVPRP